MTVPQSNNQTHPKQIRHPTDEEEVKGIGGKANESEASKCEVQDIRGSKEE